MLAGSKSVGRHIEEQRAVGTKRLGDSGGMPQSGVFIYEILCLHLCPQGIRPADGRYHHHSPPAPSG